MKQYYKWMLTAIMAVMLAVVGCGKKSSVDTKPLESSFQSADSADKSSADKAVSAIKAGDYSGAMSELKSLASKAKLTPEQQQAIKDVLAQVQQAITDAAGKAVGAAEKSAKDLQKALPK